MKGPYFATDGFATDGLGSCCAPALGLVKATIIPAPTPINRLPTVLAPQPPPETKNSRALGLVILAGVALGGVLIVRTLRKRR